MRNAEEKNVEAKEKSPLAALLIVDAEDFFVDAEEFFVMEKSSMRHAPNVRVDAANGMHHEKNVIMDAKTAGVDAEGRVQDAHARRVDAKEFSFHEKSPGADE
jgi:hypothetical protein